MAVYLGNSKKLKIVSNNATYHISLLPVTSTVEDIRLLSSDGYVLKDFNGFYLTPKEVE